MHTKKKKYKYLINVDSEDEGEATISCAGGGDTIITLPIEIEKRIKGDCYSLQLRGLMGGHSGVEIDQQRLNGIKVISKVLNEISVMDKVFRLVEINAGIAKNVIPSDVDVVFSVWEGAETLN